MEKALAEILSKICFVFYKTRVNDEGERVASE